MPFQFTHPWWLAALAAAPTGGTLYAATGSQLGSVNLGTGAYTFACTLVLAFGSPLIVVVAIFWCQTWSRN